MQPYQDVADQNNFYYYRDSAYLQTNILTTKLSQCFVPEFISYNDSSIQLDLPPTNWNQVIWVIKASLIKQTYNISSQHLKYIILIKIITLIQQIYLLKSDLLQQAGVENASNTS